MGMKQREAGAQVPFPANRCRPAFNEWTAIACFTENSATDTHRLDVLAKGMVKSLIHDLIDIYFGEIHVGQL